MSSTLSSLRGRGEAALVAYMMAGYPSERGSSAVLRGLAAGGADVIELGFPFSDPLADGPVIQDAAARSLRGGATFARFLSFVKRARTMTDAPLALMTYANVLYRRGYAAAVSEAASAGIDGFVVPDLPVDDAESAEYRDAAAAAGADTVFLASPNTPDGRLREIAAASSGFVYLAAVYGTTGARASAAGYSLRAVRRARRVVGARTPVAAGFGVSSPAGVRAYVDAGADAVVVGSALVGAAGAAVAAGGGARRIGADVESLTARLKGATVRRRRRRRAGGGAAAVAAAVAAAGRRGRSPGRR